MPSASASSSARRTSSASAGTSEGLRTGSDEMSEAAPQAAGGTHTEDVQQALDYLRLLWGDEFLIGHDDQGYWATRHGDSAAASCARTPRQAGRADERLRRNRTMTGISYVTESAGHMGYPVTGSCVTEDGRRRLLPRGALPDYRRVQEMPPADTPDPGCRWSGRTCACPQGPWRMRRERVGVGRGRGGQRRVRGQRRRRPRTGSRRGMADGQPARDRGARHGAAE